VALAIGVACGVALFRLHAGVIRVIAGAALAGLLLALAGVAAP